ncbi:MAG: DUF1292 domain-containing protein [Raoultibacter sp.]
MREGSAPNFCPPVEEGIIFTFEDEEGELTDLEFLGLVLREDTRFGFFFPTSKDAPAGSSGEVVVLEVTELDDEGQPAAFELVDDDVLAQEVYEEFQRATKEFYDFSE